MLVLPYHIPGSAPLRLQRCARCCRQRWPRTRRDSHRRHCCRPRGRRRGFHVKRIPLGIKLHLLLLDLLLLLHQQPLLLHAILML